MSEQPGLRERKKQQKRETIQRVATRLFAERGFHGTTVADIAAAAEVAPSTVFAYFPTKEDIVFASWEPFQSSFQQRLANRPTGETAIEALRDWSARVLPAILAPPTEDQLILRDVIDRDERLLAQERFRLAQFERVLAAAFARDLAGPSDAMVPRLVAGAAVGAMTSLVTFGAHAPSDQRERQIELVIAFVEAGLQAIAHQAGE